MIHAVQKKLCSSDTTSLARKYILLLNAIVHANIFHYDGLSVW